MSSQSGWSGLSGWSSNSGWSGLSGWAGTSGWGAASSGGLGNGNEASPLLIDALIKNRGALVPEGQFSASLKPLPKEAAAGDTASMRFWEHGARMLSHLEFDNENKPRMGKLTESSSVLSIRGKKSNSELVRIKRPPREYFQKQLPLVASWAELRDDRASEIVAELTPQIPFWSSILHLSPSRTPHTLELIDLILAFAFTITMRFKQSLACPRPVEYSPLIQPIIPTPDHSSLPGGHATEAYIVAFVLPKLIGANGAKYALQLEALAARIAINRTVAGLHFPIDNHAGRLLAMSLAEYVVRLATNVGEVNLRSVDSKDVPFDFDPNFNQSVSPVTDLPSFVDNLSPLRWMWKEAQAEWR
jgi:hypothetical protein